MKRIKFLASILVILIIAMGCSQTINYSSEEVNTNQNSRSVVNKPFPQNGLYSSGLIKPSTSQSETSSAIKSYYDQWKKTYGTEYSFTNGKVDGTGQGYVIKGEANGGTWNWPSHARTITTSEAHGYGMIIFALMAGHDPEAKILFDKMYKTKVNFPSLYSDNLTSWVFPVGGDLSLQNQPCATDGDMDIAYALLLADKQWGGGPAGYNITYKQAAIDMINDLGELTILTDNDGNWTHFPRLGTSDSIYGPFYPERATRPSDFMIGHMDIFEKLATSATAKKNWSDVKAGTIAIVDYVQANIANNTGLMPEFLASKNAVFNSNISTYQNISDENGGIYDNTFYSNACRFPWRYSMGYAQTKNPNVKAVLDNLNNWIVTNHKSEGAYDPSLTRQGYLLNGTPDSRHYQIADMGVKAGFMTALAVSNDQTALTKAWEANKTFQYPSQWSTMYYQNSINLLTLLYVTGNWWNPMVSGQEDLPPTKPGKPVISNISYHTADMQWAKSNDDNGEVYYEVYSGNMFIGTSTTNSYRPDPNGKYSLRDDWEHSITVIAVDNIGQKSERSEATTFKTLKVVVQPPSKPGIPVFTEITQTSVKISWTQSVQQGPDASLKGHLINVTGKDEIFVNPTVSSYTLTGLTKGTEYTVTIEGINNWNIKSEPSSDTFKTLNGTGPVVPEDPAATAKPSSFTLSKDNWNGNSTYKIIANMYWGQNATVVKLYENDILVETKKPSFDTPSAQRIEFSFTGKAKGSYVYKMEAINQHGTTITSDFTYTVTK